MRGKGKLFMLLFAILLTLQGLSLTVNAETIISGGFEGEIYTDGTVMITGYTGSDEDLVIPKTINGFTVIAIGTSAFNKCSSLVSVTIPNTVTVIEDYAFSNCSSLVTVDIPDSVTLIGQGAFDNCTSLIDIEIPEGLTTIEYYTFSGCNSLSNIEIPDSVEIIERYAFSETCYTENSENWTDGVLYIGNWLIEADSEKVTGIYSIREGTIGIANSGFSGCSDLIGVEVPSTLKNIPGSAFFNCNSLETITVSADNLYYISADGILFTKDKTELIRYPAGKGDSYYQIPDGVKSIRQQ
ncbi:MAG: leucine-rich repeat domain-containing protein [Lachnospiraceae bacterium]|nr:leucine-rich repeat domain-containing protein [Lachnospiraceae bacterium]